MFGWFQRSKVKTVSTTQGSHGKHWRAVYHHDIQQEEMINHVRESFQTGQAWGVNRTTVLIDGPFIRSIVSYEDLVTSFPYWKGTKYEVVSSKLISEWSHTQGMEAVVTVVHASGCALSFFATDYVFNKNRYKKEENIQVNIVGFAYALDVFDVEKANSQTQGKEIEIQGEKKKIKFSENFCMYMPTGESAEINFVGTVLAVREHKLSTVAGFIVTLALTPAFSLDVFVALTNLKIELVEGKQVTGVLWLLGTLENSVQ